MYTAIFPFQEVKHNPNNLAYSQPDSESIAISIKQLIMLEVES